MRTKEFWFFTSICTVSIFIEVLFHESIHLIFGRLMGIPAKFLSLTSVGVPRDYDLSMHSEKALFLMNVPAVWISVLVGVIAFIIMLKYKNLLKNIFGFFLTWLAIANLPYLALQLLTVGVKTNANGEGMDFAYMTYILHFSNPMIFFCLILALILMPISYYLLSFMFEKKESSLQFNKLKVYRKILALVFALIPIGYFLFSIFKFLIRGEIIINVGTSLLFFIIPLIVSMLIVLNYKDEESASLFKKFFFPGLFLGIVLFIPYILWIIPITKSFIEPIARVLNDFCMVILLIFPQLVGMIFFFQWRKPIQKLKNL